MRQLIHGASGICGVSPMPTRVTRKQMRMSPCAHWNTFQALAPITPNPLRYSCMMGDLKAKDCAVCCIYSASVPPEQDRLINPTWPSKGAKTLLGICVEQQRQLGFLHVPSVVNENMDNDTLSLLQAELDLISEHKNWLGFRDISFLLYVAHRQKLDALLPLLSLELEPGRIVQALVFEQINGENELKVSLYTGENGNFERTTVTLSAHILIDKLREG